MLSLSLNYDSFGGQDAVFNYLFDIGLLNKTCPVCKKEARVYFEPDRSIQRYWCKCNKSKISCATNTALDFNGIEKIPLFIFVLQCFCLGINVKSIIALTGADYRTINKYIESLREALSAAAKQEQKEGRLKLGGPGKVVEVDEMPICRRKYESSKRTAKEGIWIVGLTEVDAASHLI